MRNPDYSLGNQVIIPLTELVSLSQLMLRWPFECFRKIAYMVNADICPPSPQPKHKRINIYLATRLAKDHNNNECLALETFGVYINPKLAESSYLSRLYFRLSDIEDVEAGNPDLALIELFDSPDNEPLVCMPENIEKVAVLVMHYLVNFYQVCAPFYKPFLNAYPDPIPGIDPSEAPDRTRYILTKFHGVHYSFCLGSALHGTPVDYPPTNFPQAYSRRDIMPVPLIDGLTIRAKDNRPKDENKPGFKSPESRKREEYIFDTYAPKIAQWTSMGQDDPSVLARYLITTYPELGVGEIGFLLPATLFPSSKIGSFKPLNYSANRAKVTGISLKSERVRKQGQRLLGW